MKSKKQEKSNGTTDASRFSTRVDLVEARMREIIKVSASVVVDPDDIGSQRKLPTLLRKLNRSYEWVIRALRDLEHDTHQLQVEKRVLQERRDSLTRENERLEKEAKIDPLTGLLKGVEFRNQLESLLSHPRRRKFEEGLAALWYMDVREFKAINDGEGLGHSVGDQVLIQTATLIREKVRSERGEDLHARNSEAADEFLVFMPDLPNFQLIVRATERLIEAIRNHLWTHEGVGKLQPGEVCIDIGVVYWEEFTKLPPGTDVSNIAGKAIDQADKAMYSVKNEGRPGGGVEYRKATIEGGEFRLVESLTEPL